MSEQRESSPRQIVSYFDHEFIEPTASKVQNDIDQMAEAGFSHVVLCVTEADIASTRRQKQLESMRQSIEERGLEVWADPWGVGRVFGGEAESEFAKSELSCICNPKLDQLLSGWLETVEQAGFETVFWDEPQLRHDIHEDNEFEFIEKYTRQAGELALKSVVVQCANEKHRDKQFVQIRRIAELPDVVEIATDPYYPNAFVPANRLPETERLDYVARWIDHTQAVAQETGKRSHVWVQCFDVPEGREQMIPEHIQLCRERMADIAIWGFNGCASVPNFAKPGDVDPAQLWRLTIETL